MVALFARSIFLYVFILFGSLVNGQQSISALLDTAYNCRMKADYTRNFYFLNQAEQHLEKGTDPLLTVQLYAELSKHYLINGNYDNAKTYAAKSLQTGKASRNAIAEAYGYGALASWYNYLSVGDLAVSNAQEGLRLVQQQKQPALKAQLYYTLYGVYSAWDDIALTDKYARLCVAAALEAQQYERLSNAYTARSVVMEYHYKKTKDPVYLDSMRNDLHRSVQLYNDFPGKVGVRTYAIANLNLADFFFKYQSPDKTATRDSILHYTNIAAQTARGFDKNYEIMGNVNGLFSEIAQQQGNSDMAEAYLMDSYIHLTEAPRPSYYTLLNVAQGLANLYEKRDDFKRALLFQRKKEAFNDSIFNQSQVQQSKRLEAQFENKRLADDIKAAELKAKNRTNQNLLLSGISVLLLLSLFLVLHSAKSRAKLQEQKTLQLQKENEEARQRAQMQLKVEKEEQARLKAEQELLLVQKEQMQKEAMADALQIERKNRLLLQMREKLTKLETESNKGYVDKVIKEEMRLEEIVERSAKEFEQINPVFFRILKERSDNKLTTLELKHCAYIHLKLNTKEIATAFHIAPKSVRVSKYRIKQKLGLDKDTDLDHFLEELK
ncbi:hypothetical protein [Niabella beijingensis]|uniref:hypothetical protein n=1 Tax=Niabella beijingensis TaxID=2872700 RepID=UPI001CBE3100|nr:hypothetical protein [Niabella beijingensis]MBZ4192677.1 hypothetical protein [Niabella beijingensis]